VILCAMCNVKFIMLIVYCIDMCSKPFLLLKHLKGNRNQENNALFFEHQFEECVTKSVVADRL